MWAQGYDPFGNPVLSTLTAAVPIVVLLGCIAFLKMKAHIAALLGMGSSLTVAILAFKMPVGLATTAAAFGAAYGLMPIGWIVINVIFLYIARLSSVGRSEYSRTASPRSRATGACNCC